MYFPTWHRFIERTFYPRRQTVRRRRSRRLQCEALEARLQPTAFTFHTGVPDGRIATVSEPANAHNSQVEFETADDFVLPSATRIDNASFTGLLTGGATLSDVSNVVITIYRVFPNDSDTTRTPQVPTRNNSPADNEIENRDSAARDLFFRGQVLSESFAAQNSVSSVDRIGVHSGGNGSVTGEEVHFDVKLRVPLDLAAGRYFFVPKVGLSDQAPGGADFLWLSAPRVVAPPAPNKPPRIDLQTWMRNDPGLAPDWLRVGADIIGGTSFNGSFAVSGEALPSGTNAVPELAGVPFKENSLPTAGSISGAAGGAKILHATDKAPPVTALRSENANAQNVIGTHKSPPLHGQGNGENGQFDENVSGAGQVL
jgi:hypothetical protein